MLIDLATNVNQQLIEAKALPHGGVIARMKKEERDENFFAYITDNNSDYISLFVDFINYYSKKLQLYFIYQRATF